MKVAHLFKNNKKVVVAVSVLVVLSIISISILNTRNKTNPIKVTSEIFRPMNNTDDKQKDESIVNKYDGQGDEFHFMKGWNDNKAGVHYVEERENSLYVIGNKDKGKEWIPLLTTLEGDFSKFKYLSIRLTGPIGKPVFLKAETRLNEIVGQIFVTNGYEQILTIDLSKAKTDYKLMDCVSIFFLPGETGSYEFNLHDAWLSVDKPERVKGDPTLMSPWVDGWSGSYNVTQEGNTSYVDYNGLIQWSMIKSQIPYPDPLYKQLNMTIDVFSNKNIDVGIKIMYDNLDGEMVDPEMFGFLVLNPGTNKICLDLSEIFDRQDVVPTAVQLYIDSTSEDINKSGSLAISSYYLSKPTGDAEDVSENPGFIRCGKYTTESWTNYNLNYISSDSVLVDFDNAAEWGFILYDKKLTYDENKINIRLENIDNSVSYIELMLIGDNKEYPEEHLFYEANVAVLTKEDLYGNNGEIKDFEINLANAIESLKGHANNGYRLKLRVESDPNNKQEYDGKGKFIIHQIIPGKYTLTDKPELGFWHRAYGNQNINIKNGVIEVNYENPKSYSNIAAYILTKEFNPLYNNLRMNIDSINGSAKKLTVGVLYDNYTDSQWGTIDLLAGNHEYNFDLNNLFNTKGKKPVKLLFYFDSIGDNYNKNKATVRISNVKLTVPGKGPKLIGLEDFQVGYGTYKLIKENDKLAVSYNNMIKWGNITTGVKNYVKGTNKLVINIDSLNGDTKELVVQAYDKNSKSTNIGTIVLKEGRRDYELVIPKEVDVDKLVFYTDSFGVGGNSGRFDIYSAKIEKIDDPIELSGPELIGVKDIKVGHGEYKLVKEDGRMYIGYDNVAAWGNIYMETDNYVVGNNELKLDIESIDGTAERLTVEVYEGENKIELETLQLQSGRQQYTVKLPENKNLSKIVMYIDSRNLGEKDNSGSLYLYSAKIQSGEEKPDIESKFENIGFGEWTVDTWSNPTYEMTQNNKALNIKFNPAQIDKWLGISADVLNFDTIKDELIVDLSIKEGSEFYMNVKVVYEDGSDKFTGADIKSGRGTYVINLPENTQNNPIVKVYIMFNEPWSDSEKPNESREINIYRFELKESIKEEIFENIGFGEWEADTWSDSTYDIIKNNDALNIKFNPSKLDPWVGIGADVLEFNKENNKLKIDAEIINGSEFNLLIKLVYNDGSDTFLGKDVTKDRQEYVYDLTGKLDKPISKVYMLLNQPWGIQADEEKEINIYSIKIQQ